MSKVIFSGSLVTLIAVAPETIGDHHGGPETEDRQGGQHRDERHADVADAGEPDLAHVGDVGQDGKRDERPGEGHAIA